MASKVIGTLAMSLPVLFLKERKAYIAYSPALDLSASGSSPARAKKNFQVTLKLFLEDLVERDTLDLVLRELGWSRHERTWQPPVEVGKMTNVAFKVPVAA